MGLVRCLFLIKADPERYFCCRVPKLLTAEITVDLTIWHHYPERPSVRLITLDFFHPEGSSDLSSMK